MLENFREHGGVQFWKHNTKNIMTITLSGLSLTKKSILVYTMHNMMRLGRENLIRYHTLFSFCFHRHLKKVYMHNNL